MHYAEHLREAFLAWIDEGYPPTARVEVDYREQEWPAERLLKRMQRCSDVVPTPYRQQLRDELGLELRSYAAVARALLNAWPEDTTEVREAAR
jgi:hypothetical protein